MGTTKSTQVHAKDCADDGLGACVNESFYFRPDDYSRCWPHDGLPRPWVRLVQQNWRRLLLRGERSFRESLSPAAVNAAGVPPTGVPLHSAIIHFFAIAVLPPLSGPCILPPPSSLGHRTRTGVISNNAIAASEETTAPNQKPNPSRSHTAASGRYAFVEASRHRR